MTLYPQSLGEAERATPLSSLEKPFLVLVGGAAASGKTTLADRLAREVRLPLLSRDALKEALMDSLGSPNCARSRELGTASYAVLYAVLDRLLAAGVGAVVESNFSRGRAERELQGPLTRAHAVQVHCQTTPDEARRRYVARAASGERHRGHHDADAETLADLDASFASGRHEPLDLDVPLLRVDTTDGYAPSFEAIRAFIASGTAAGAPVSPDVGMSR